MTGETCLEMNHFLSGTGSPRSRPACQMCVANWCVESTHICRPVKELIHVKFMQTVSAVVLNFQCCAQKVLHAQLQIK